MKNLRELGSSPFHYIVPIIPSSLPKELVRGKYFILADLLKSIQGSFSQAGSVEEPQAEINEGALVSYVRPNQSPLAIQDPDPALRFAKKKGKIKAAEAAKKKK